MRRVVITGLGIVSCIGNDKNSVSAALRAGQSGISFQPIYAELGMRSQVAGLPSIDLDACIDRKAKRFMGDAAAYAYAAMQSAIIDANLQEQHVSNVRTGLVAGSGGASSHFQVEAADLLRQKGIKKVGPYMVTRTMASTVSACLATPFKIKGVNYSMASACATSAHCIGHAMELIQLNKQDIVFAGGGEELDWTLSSLFDAMGALSSQYNNTPALASRAFDQERDGFVIAGGGGMVVVESLEHALDRGAHIYAELVGYGCSSDGADMVAPSGEGAERCMRQALDQANTKVDYINVHGTSTPRGDITELQAIERAFAGNTFNKKIPSISSTKSMTGHSLGAAGVQEAIYCLLMMEDSFIAPSINIAKLDEQATGFPIQTQLIQTEVNAVLSNSFGFGGTNASLLMKKYTH